MSSGPLHARLADALRERIVSGALAVGAPLPSEAHLVEEFALSRGTVRQALSALRHEGLIEGGRGRRPVVRRRPMGQPFETFLSFTAWALQSGHVPGQRTIELARRGAGPEAAAALGVAPGEPVVDVLRLRLLDGEPVMLERSTFTLAIGRLLFDFDPDAGSIYAGLHERGVDIAGATHTIDAIAAPGEDARLLGVAKGGPLLRERRTATTTGGDPVEYADDRYRPDRATFTIANARAHHLAFARTLPDQGETP
ncbi:GntR family transcriptional regulator [Actinomadura parmotrematis]|uniref:GntR family transcriptional regulator n=1 Tax=Actinomadura parmotrematis TaxID=2864039 RepID=A0ABS7FQP8_9ACTN|nr:GntR family transcriptional regulator [Actinomadura parmotrematis]MBW8482733.1 GntR family transcriptional regulator [Actinomadura parmotrematis]